MKKLIAILLLTATTWSVTSAQQVDTRRKIEVYGAAEEEITPDIIYVAISLKEYFKSNNKDKVTIDALEKQLAAAIKKAGIQESDLTIENISSYHYIDPKKKKDPGFLASKQYKIKVSDLNAINEILAGIDEKGIQSTNITGYDHSRMDEIKDKLRIKAIANAKAKATVMAQALGDTLGKALEVTDNNTDTGTPQPMFKTMAMRAADAPMEESLDIDFKKIKVNYQFRVVFELK